MNKETHNKETHDLSFSVQGLFLGFIALVLSLLRQDPIWSIVSLLFIFLILKMSKISKEERMKRAALKIVLIPLFVGAVTPIYSPLGKIAFAAILPILGFMILFTLIHTSEFKTNFEFTAAFIFLFSLAIGALSAIGRFMSDRFLGTNYLLGNEHLMLEFLLIMFFGILGALIFIQYRGEYYTKDKVNINTSQLKSKLRVKSGYSGSHFFKLLDSFFWSKEKTSLLRTSFVLQAGILVMVFYNLSIENFWAFSVSLVSFGLSLIPHLVSPSLKVKVSPSFQFWVAATLFLYASSESLRFQQIFGWWNTFTHLIAGIMVGTIVIIYIFYLKDISANLHIPTKMIPILVLTFILSISVLWEIFEFLLDSLFSTGLQPNLQNTVYDMIANTIGTFFALLIARFLTPFETITKILDHKKEINLDNISLPSFEKMKLSNISRPSLRILFSTVGVIGILLGIVGILIFAISSSLYIPSRINLLFVLVSIISISVLLVIFIVSISVLWENIESLSDCIIKKKRT
ncbi:MAG: hypothetical protein ACOCSJ_01510 [Candidatus Natronoplasma sp.]